MVVRLKDLDSGQKKSGVVRLSDLEQSKQPDISPVQKTINSGAVQGLTKTFNTLRSGKLPELQASQEEKKPGRDIPVIGSVLRGLDAFAANPITKKVGEIGQMVYTPGAGVANVAGLFGAAGAGISKVAPKLGSTLGGRVAQGAIQAGVTEAPIAMGNALSSQTQDIGEAAQMGLIGGGLGAVGGAAGPLIGRGIQSLRASRGVAEVMPQETLALPPASRYESARSRAEGTVLSTNETPIYGQGDIHTFALPEPDVLPPTRARLESRVNPYEQKLNQLFEVAKQENMPPGRERETLDDLWSRMAGPNDPSLDELIDLAYPKRQNSLSTNLASRAREQQRMREVSGAPNIVRSMDDRYQPFVGEAAGPTTKVGIRQPGVEIKAPVRKFATQPKLNTQVGKRTESPVQGVVNEVAAAQSGGTFVRGNYKNQLNNGKFSKELNKGIRSTDQTYERITNAETVAKANENVKNLTDAESKFHGNEVITPEHIATGYRLIQELDRGGHTERALNVANKLAADLTRGGQSTQAAAVLQRLSPEGRLLDLTRRADKNGKAVTEADGQAYMALAREAHSAGLAGQRSAEVMDIFDRARKGGKISPEDSTKLNELVKDMKSYIKAKEGKPPKEAKLSPKMAEKKMRDQVLGVLQEQEAKVLERMRARGNRLSSTPFDVYADYALLGSIKLAKGAISFSKWSEQMIKDVGNEIKPHLAPIYEKSQRLLENAANKITDVKVNAAEKVAEKFIKEGSISSEDENMLRELAKQLNELSNNRGMKADMKMQQILNGYQKSNLGGKVATLRYIGMLLNTSTQAVNAISGPMMMTYHHMLDMMATPLDLIYSGVTKSPRSTTFKQGPGAFDNLFTPVMDWFKGLKVGGKAGWQGVDPEGIATQHDIRGLSFKSKLNPVGLAERTLGAVAKGPDYATFNASRNIEMRKLAYLDSINKGIKGKQNIRNYMEKFLSNPDPNALEQASRIGKKLTFQNTEGVAGKAAKAARSVNALTGSKDLGLANVISPFVRTPLNIAITGIENTPAGVLKGLFEINRLRRGADDISKREILKTFVSATLGGTVTLGGLGYVLSDLGIITGDYSSSDRDVQPLQDSIGKGKFRFNTSAFGRMFDALTSGDIDKLKELSQYREGDKQIDYNRMQPLAFPVAAGATYQQGKDKPTGERLAASGKSSLSSLFGMSALQGLQQNFTTKPGSTGSEIPLQIGQNIGENFAKSFSPSALAQEARRQDPLQRNVSYNGSFGEDVSSYYKSRTPGLSKTLQPKQNNLGDLKQNAPGVLGQYVNPLRSEVSTYNKAAQIVNDLITRTGDEKLAPTAMDKTIRGTLKGQKLQTSVKLEPTRYTQLQQDVGKEIARRIIELPQNLDDAARAKKIEEIYNSVKDSARTKLKKELGFKIQ